MVERGRAAGEGKVVGQGESRGRIAGGDGTSQWLHFLTVAYNRQFPISAVVELSESREKSRHPYGFSRVGRKREFLLNLQPGNGIVGIPQGCIDDGHRINRNHAHGVTAERYTVEHHH